MFFHCSLRRFSSLVLLLVFAGPLWASPQQVIPPASAVRGWKQVGTTRLYNANNLYQLINGEAEAVLDYAFAGTAYAAFAPGGQSTPVLTITVFDMSNDLNAFGLFGSDRQSGTAAHIGTESVLIGNSGLNFWKGRYVVRLSITRPTAANRAALMALARAAASRITGAVRKPAMLRVLPPGYQARSEKYVRQNYGGHRFLRNVMAARYPAAGNNAELFAALYTSVTNANGALAAFRQRAARGSNLQNVSGAGWSGFSYRDRYAGTIVVVRRGNWLVGVQRARDAATGLNLTKRALARV